MLIYAQVGSKDIGRVRQFNTTALIKTGSMHQHWQIDMVSVCVGQNRAEVSRFE